jgi:hypothetical protein
VLKSVLHGCSFEIQFYLLFINEYPCTGIKTFNIYSGKTSSILVISGCCVLWCLLIGLTLLSGWRTWLSVCHDSGASTRCDQLYRRPTAKTLTLLLGIRGIVPRVLGRTLHAINMPSRFDLKECTIERERTPIICVVFLPFYLEGCWGLVCVSLRTSGLCCRGAEDRVCLSVLRRAVTR